MKSSLMLALLGVVTTTSALVFENEAPQQQTVQKGKFGAMEIIDWLDEGMSK
jgi:hypothetical protein